MKKGFTIVELLVVIIVIGILAAIAVVAYTGISQKANIASLQSDLSNSAIKLKMYKTEYGYFPNNPLDGNNCPLTPTADTTKYCLKPSSNTTFAYTGGGQTFTLTATRNSISYSITEDSTPSLVAALTCPAGFIVIPGSATYGTSDFCVMKYEAKQVGATTVPISEAAGTPWVNVPQELAGANNDAKEYAQNVAGCTGCHLITENEWLTIVQNVLSVTSNWSSGIVGSGYIFSGHNDGSPASALTVTNPGNDYSDTGNTTPSNQRRTLTLSNGEVIWDLAGNVWENTSGQTNGTTAQQPGVTGAGSAVRDWPSITNSGTITPNPNPTTTGISGAGSWDRNYGIGIILSNADETVQRNFLRGGSSTNNNLAGILSLHLGSTPATASSTTGFRVSR